jgi:hypothetical protein
MINSHACFMQCLRKIKNLDIIEGISYHELYILQDFLSSVAKDGFTVIEIGSWKGCSSYFLAHIMNHFKYCKLYCIDTWKGNEDTWQKEEIAQHDIKEIFDLNTAEFNHIIVPLRENSNAAHIEFKDESIDFMFMDGDHTHNGLYSDLTNYYPKLKTGGVICGHDSNIRYENLSRKFRIIINRHIDEDCIFIKSLLRRIHCGVAKALYDFFGSDYYRIEETDLAEEGVKNSLWWHIKE